jgi:MFS family permease
LLLQNHLKHCAAEAIRSNDPERSDAMYEELFQVVFVLAFFCLSWYNGPMTAVIFDVVPSRISATVAGAYLLFIHLAGDAIALPLVGSLSDRFGLDRAVLLLPAAVIVGGVTVLGAIRTVGRDMHRQGVERAAA